VEQGPAASVLNNPQESYTRDLIAAAPGLSPRRLRGRASSSQETSRDAGTDVAPLVTATKLRKEFRLPRTRAGAGSITAVDDVSFDIHRGETLSLVGESGSGKSTVARLLLRLEKPTAGSVTFDGVDLSTAKGEQLRLLRRRFQVVFQSPFASLDPRFSVADSIGEPLRAFRDGSTKERENKVAALLDSVQLPAGFATRRPVELSGGQRQRVAIARALALGPDLVVLDEAVSALDVSVQAQILDLLAGLQERDGLSYLFISHDLAVVEHISDRVAVMRGGKLVEIGPTADVLGCPAHEYTRQLISAIPGRKPALA
jgi:peptide/nickel transport system ATP-binding protein